MVRSGAFLGVALVGLSLSSVAGQTKEQMAEERANIAAHYTHSHHHGHHPGKSAVPPEAYTAWALTPAPTATPTASPTAPSRRIRFHAALHDGWAPCLHLGCKHTKEKFCPPGQADCEETLSGADKWRIVIYHHGEETSKVHNCGLDPSIPGQLLSDRTCSCFCKIDKLGFPGLIPVDSNLEGGEGMQAIDKDTRVWPQLISMGDMPDLNQEAVAAGESEVEHAMVDGQGADLREAGHFPHSVDLIPSEPQAMRERITPTAN